MFGTWTLLSEDGATAVNFTSFLGLDLQRGGQVLAQPVEQGAFASYHKTREAMTMRLTLGLSPGLNGDLSGLAVALARLEHFRDQAVCLIVVTPSAIYSNLTLRSFTHSQQPESGAGMLTISLDLVEVRQLSASLPSLSAVISKPLNLTSALQVRLGKVQPEIAAKAAGLGREVFNAIWGK